MKTVFSSQRRETLSFLITTVATVTSRVNQQYTYYSGALSFRKKKQQQSRRYVYTTVDNRERARASY